LAEPLPREIDLSSTASLEFALWSTTLANTIDVLTTANTYPYEINFTTDLGALTQS
jgi:hypothetical protein